MRRIAMRRIAALGPAAALALSFAACNQSSSGSTPPQGSTAVGSPEQAAAAKSDAPKAAANDDPTCAVIAAQLTKLLGHDRDPKDAEFMKGMLTQGCESAGNLPTIDRALIQCIMKAADKSASQACGEARVTDLVKTWEKALKADLKKGLEGDQNKVGSCNVIKTAGSCREYRGTDLEMYPRGLCDGQFKLEPCPTENRTSSCKTAAEGTDFYYKVAAAGTLESQQKFCKEVRSGEWSEL